MYICREFGKSCDLANEMGYCKVTGCIRREVEAEITIKMALNDCKTKHNECENCGTECMWRDK